MTNRIIDIARGHDIIHNGTVDQGSYGMAPYIAYNGSSNYGTRPAGALKGLNGFTVGGWFQMTSGDFLMGVWQTAANQVWRLYVNVSAPTFMCRQPALIRSAWQPLASRRALGIS